MGYRSTDVVATRPGRDRRDLRLLSFTCVLVLFEGFDSSSTLFDILFFHSFFSFSPSLSLDPWGQAHCSCIIAIAPREKLNLKLIDCRNEWYANCHTILSSLVSPSNVNDKTCLAPREKNGTRVPRIVEFLTIFNSLDYI